jgi:hypothetical protein
MNGQDQPWSRSTEAKLRSGGHLTVTCLSVELYTGNVMNLRHEMAVMWRLRIRKRTVCATANRPVSACGETASGFYA